MSGPLYPPLNYAPAEVDLYRSAMPTALNYPFIRSLRIKTFLVLSPESATEEFIDFLDSCGSRAVFVENRIPGSRREVGTNSDASSSGSYSSMKTGGSGYAANIPGASTVAGASRVQSMPSSSSASTAPIVEDMVTTALEVLVDQSNYPVYVSCKYGKLLVGVVVACLRKLQRWNLVSIFEEFRRFSRARYLEQEQFIELYDTDLISVTAQAPLFLRKAYRIGVPMRQSSSKTSMDQPPPQPLPGGGETPSSSLPPVRSASSLATPIALGQEGSEAQLDGIVPRDENEGVIV